MGTAVGGVDARRRPLVRVRRIGAEDDFLVLLDTGFNGDLHMTLGMARRLGFELRPEKEPMEFADGRRESVQVGRGTIEWLGEQRIVAVFASPDPPKPRPVRKGEYVALLGTGLLSPHILLVDFTAMTVEIEAQS